MPTNKELAKRRKEAVTPAAYSVHPFSPKKAKGSYIWDADGKKYLDWSVGIAVMNIGHSHPKVLEAVKAQIDEFQHLCFAVGMNETYIQVAEKLNEIAPGKSPKKTFLVNTGAEAVTGRTGIISFTYAFHGRTYMAMSLTAKADPYKIGFAPRASEVYRAHYPYTYRNAWGAKTEEECARAALEALKDQIHTTIGESEVAGIILEPIAGEGGFIPAPESFLKGIQDYCKEIGALWIDDEVQAGIGRTGAWWAVDHYGLEPDLVCSAKALSSGFPLSAVIGKADIMDKLKPGMLGSTFGGNPAGCAAALATLQVIEEENLLERASELGAVLKDRLQKMQAKHKQIGDVRGLGAMIGIEFIKDVNKTPDEESVKKIVEVARDNGLILLSTGTYGNVIRLLPPINMSDAELNEGLEKLEAAISQVLTSQYAVA
jgi:4-aminobutyrate aminotransferase / (S)-3-amino-2-methylpropionate transaminase / 5-aminovalerate transaminase